MLSVVVPAWNESRRICATLDALHGAATRLDVDYEAIVVDDASSDDTAARAVECGARVVPVAFRQIAATRNAGARAARGDRLLFLDADTLVDDAVLRAALSALDAGAIGGGCAVRLQGAPAWHVRLAVAASAVAFRVAGIAPGCFLFCTRTAFDAAGGFDEAWFAGEDVAMSRALARQGRFVILREAVRTSGRKLRQYPPGAQLKLMLRFVLRGKTMLRGRDELWLWYGERDDDGTEAIRPPQR